MDSKAATYSKDDLIHIDTTITRKTHWGEEACEDYETHSSDAVEINNTWIGVNLIWRCFRYRVFQMGFCAFRNNIVVLCGAMTALVYLNFKWDTETS